MILTAAEPGLYGAAPSAATRARGRPASCRPSPSVRAPLLRAVASRLRGGGSGERDDSEQGHGEQGQCALLDRRRALLGRRQEEDEGGREHGARSGEGEGEADPG